MEITKSWGGRAFSDRLLRGSLFETVTLLIIINRLNWLADNRLLELKSLAEEIAKMLNSLIKSMRK